MGSGYLAHLKVDDNGIQRCQTLRDHNRNVGNYAAECLSSAGLRNCGMLSGLLHDGKGTENYQVYLRECAAWDAFDQGVAKMPAGQRPQRGSVNHTFAGVIYLIDRFHGKGDLLADYTSEIISCAIGSHHGLFDCQNLEDRNGFVHRVKETDRKKIQYDEAKAAFENEVSSPDEIAKLFNSAETEILALMKNIASTNMEGDGVSQAYLNMGLSMTIRLITSALIYADRRDTAEFSEREKYADISENWERDIEDYEKQYSQLLEGGTASASQINAVRQSISGQCQSFAENPGSIYRLNVPTGGGKTLASLRYALYHAKAFNKKKIIYVIPLLTIIEQNAAEIKKYLPNAVILEHHSDVITDSMTCDELKTYDLLKDRWSAPIIITTLVQILEILFGSKTASIARMRALCNSVIIFDEVQSVPYHSLALFNSALNFLAENCKSTIILCSATQPEFDRLKEYPLHVSRKQMVSLTEAQLQPFKRQKYHDETPSTLTIEELAEKVLSLLPDQNPVMVVCNTRSEAKSVYELLRQKGPHDLQLVHLSASMCKAHRKKTLDQIEASLQAIQEGRENESFVLVTTQLVEAGVNLSFRSVIRILAGNDNLVQTGGRCNRSNEYGAGDVYLVKLEGEDSQLRNLPEIRMAQGAMTDNLSRHRKFDPEDDSFIEDYYLTLFTDIEGKGESTYPFQYMDGKTYHVANLLSGEMNAVQSDYQLRQPFKTASEAYQVFDENTYSVIVPYEEGEKLIESIRTFSGMGKTVPRDILRQAGNYSVQIYEWQKEKLESNGMLEFLSDGQILALNPKAYDGRFGLDISKEWTTEEMIF